MPRRLRSTVFLAALSFGVSCQAGDGRGLSSGGMGEMMEEMPGWMMRGDMPMDRTMIRDMRVIHGLLMDHERIEREVEEVPGGVRTITTSRDPGTAELIRTHVHQMKDRMEEGRSIRRMDPLFREIFDHHEMIEIEVEDLPGGARVVETSADPEVAALIRQHARRAVSEFVDGGMRRAMQPTPLPEGYRRQGTSRAEEQGQIALGGEQMTDGMMGGMVIWTVVGVLLIILLTVAIVKLLHK